jgi:hypothetical protein
MEQFAEILKYILPSLVVFITVFYLFKLQLQSQEKRKILQLKQDSKNIITPLRLQAYERIILYLERINPSSIVVRLNNPALNVTQFQMMLLSTVRSEFDHNLSQQLYISSFGWSAIKNAKEEVVKLVNLAAAKVAPDAPSSELSSKIFEILVETQQNPTDYALEVVKKEISIYF